MSIMDSFSTFPPGGIHRGRFSVIALMILSAGPVLAGEARKEDKGKKAYAADKGPGKVDVSDYSAKMQKYYKIYSKRCSKCHPLARSINTRMAPDAWKRYVRRMANREGSGIPPKDARRIYFYLKYREGKLAAEGAKRKAEAAERKSEDKSSEEEPSEKESSDEKSEEADKVEAQFKSGD